MTPILIPIAAINATALPRDRTQLSAAALAELTSSIATTGLRQPIEVWTLSQPTSDHRFGLISGLRRLTAHQNLNALRADGSFAQIAAFIRSPDSIPDAMAQMVEENEIRADTSAWEKGATLIAARDAGIFDTIESACAHLHRNASRQTRARLRAFAEVVEEFDGALPTPETLTSRQMQRISLAIRAGATDLIHTVLTEQRGAKLPALWTALLPLLTEAQLDPDTTPEPQKPTRPRRLLHLRQGLTIRRERAGDSWLLRFSGPEARSGALIDDVLDRVEDWFQPK